MLHCKNHKEEVAQQHPMRYIVKPSKENINQEYIKKNPWNYLTELVSYYIGKKKDSFMVNFTLRKRDEEWWWVEGKQLTITLFMC